MDIFDNSFLFCLYLCMVIYIISLFSVLFFCRLAVVLCGSCAAVFPALYPILSPCRSWQLRWVWPHEQLYQSSTSSSSSPVSSSVIVRGEIARFRIRVMFLSFSLSSAHRLFWRHSSTPKKRWNGLYFSSVVVFYRSSIVIYRRHFL